MKTREATANMTATVLIVDDDPGARLLLGTALERAGFRVAAAPDGQAALNEFRAQAFDCVILDVVMPGMSGFDVCTSLRAVPGMHRRLAVLILSDNRQATTPFSEWRVIHPQLKSRTGQ